MGKEGQSRQEDALLSGSLSAALPALLLPQPAELGARGLAGRPGTFMHWKVRYFGGLLHTDLGQQELQVWSFSTL